MVVPRAIPEHRPRRQRYPHPPNCYRNPWGRWFVQFDHRGERYYCGTFATAEEASAAALNARGYLASLPEE